jgi:hypothetical protein
MRTNHTGSICYVVAQRVAVFVFATVLAFVMLPSRVATANDSQWSFFRQEGRAFAPLEADPREARFRFGVMYSDDGFFEDLAWGGDLAMIEGRFADSRLTVATRGLMTGRFDISSDSFDLINVDFIGGLAMGYRNLPFAVELFIYHQSSHLGDEITERGERTRIDFGVEELRLLADWRWSILRLYAGGKVTLHAFPEALGGRTILEAGAEVSGSTGNVPLYAAFDIQGRVDIPDLSAACLQGGVGLASAAVSRRVLYLFMELFAGRSSMGQYHAEREHHVLLGISYLFQ